MRKNVSRSLGAGAVALTVAMALIGVAGAQQQAQPGVDAGLVTGMVARCVNGVETPANGIAIGVDGGPATLGRSDSTGEFFISLPPGTYTVVATASDGTASRPYVPVEAGTELDIGVLDIGGGIAGCGPDSDVTAPVLPTFTPSPTAAPEPPTPTPAPTVALTATPAPAQSVPPAEPTPAAG